jgi:hypothetical protein
MPARALGAGAVLAVGAIHLQQYVVLYSSISTTGTLFVLNFAGATAIGHPDAILAGRIFEVAAVVLLGGFLAGRLIDREPGRRW